MIFVYNFKKSLTLKNFTFSSENNFCMISAIISYIAWGTETGKKGVNNCFPNCISHFIERFSKMNIQEKAI